MTKLLITTLATLYAGALFGQTFTGTWQGALEIPQAPNGELRIVIKISTTDADKLAAVMYSIDQGGQPVPATTVTAKGSNLKMSIARLNGSYEGRLSPDGNSIAGTWTQGESRPLTLARATAATAWAIPEPPPPPVLMSAKANPGFEVATIKPSDPSRPGKLFTIRGQNIITVNTTVSNLITIAYNLHIKQVVGAPAWVDSEKYDLEVKPDLPGRPNVVQMKIILQKVLADRFQLKFHRDKRELSVYALTAAKSGAKLTKSDGDPNGLPGLFFGRGNPGTSFSVTNATLAEVANALQGSILDKPMIDQTGLTGKYDFILKFTPDPGQMEGFFGPQPLATESLDAPPDLFGAFEQQLGLKLVSTKAPAEVLVVDWVDKPSAN